MAAGNAYRVQTTIFVSVQTGCRRVLGRIKNEQKQNFTISQSSEILLLFRRFRRTSFMKSEFQLKNLNVIGFILLFIMLGSQNLIYAQDDVIRVDSTLVTVPVTVLDRDGRYVTNLKKENFQIFENGVEQENYAF
jgi:hypothetical protein